MKKYKYAALGLILCPLISFAGFNKLTAHSRANCVNNESISWDATEPHILYTESTHAAYSSMPCSIAYPGYDGNPDLICSLLVTSHNMSTKVENTRMSAAVHWMESALQLIYPESNKDITWTVDGTHWIKDTDKDELHVFDHTYASDCSIYDGWWEFKH